MPKPIPTPAEQAKKQRIQLAVAGVLAVVLAVVVLYPPAAPERLDPAAAQPFVQAKPPQQQAVVEAAREQQDPLAALPELELEKVVAANPFVSPHRAALAAQGLDMLSAAAGAGGVSTHDRDARSVQEVEVQAIIHTAAQPTVLIDGEIAGLHDTIRQRWRIVEVLPQSVRVEYVGE